MNTSYIEHIFGATETIRAVIRKNNHDGMTPAMLTILMKQFNELNNNAIPKPGMKMKIPIFVGFKGQNS
jgi:hypothetical protein